MAADCLYRHPMPPSDQPAAGLGQREFIVLVSTITMIVALSIDSMLTALPAIGTALHVDTENHRQFVISVFMIGFGIAQFFAGALSDRFGRRSLMIGALFAYMLLSFAAGFAQTFEQLLAARFLQGGAAAISRVIVTAIIRDHFSGRAMARVMSLSSMIFMAAPVIAPAMGQAIVAFTTWRWIFIVLGLIGGALWVWVSVRLVESLPAERRRTLAPAAIWRGVVFVVSERQSLGYSIAMTSLSCGLMGYILSVSQIYETIFGRLDLLVTSFLAMAVVMAAASLTNSRMVMRYGMRLIGHSAMLGFVFFAGLHAAIAWTGHDTMIIFVIVQALMMGCFSFAVGNFGAMAMEHVGEAAGMASSLQGSFSTIVGAVVGGIIGQAFNGTTIPLYTGVFISGLIALLAVFVTERGQLFVARNAPTLQKD